MAQAESSAPDVRLVPAQLDLGSTGNQTIIATICVAIAAAAIAFPALGLGFITNDFSVLNAVASAANGGGAGLFLGLQHPNIAHLNIGPLGFAWLLVDFLIVRTNAFLWHLESLVLFSVCAVLTALIAAQLSNRSMSRLAPATLLWAGLLYVVYPGHVDTFSWISAQTELICAAFTLASIYFYLRFRMLREREYLVYSIVLLVLAMLTKVEAVTLPLILVACEVLVLKDDTTPTIKRVYFTMPQFLILFFLTTLSLVLTLPTTGLPHTIIKTAQLLGNPTTWQGLLFGAYGEDNTLFQLLSEASNSSLTQLLTLCYLGAIALVIFRLVKKSLPLPLFSFPLVWLALSLIYDPAHSVGHVANGRTFLFASAPLCIAFTLACLPALDMLGRASLRKLVVLGSLPLVATFGAYLCLSKQEITVWQASSVATTALIEEVTLVANRLKPGQGILVTDLPQELSGEHVDWIRFAFLEPFTNIDRIVQSATQDIMGTHAIWPQKLTATLNAINCGAILRWQTERGPIIGWAKSAGEDEYIQVFTKDGTGKLATEPDVSISNLKKDEEPSSSERPSIKSASDFMRVYAGSKPFTLWLPATNIDPLRLDVAILALKYVSEDNCPTCPIGKVSLVWNAKSVDTKKELSGTAGVVHPMGDDYLIWLGRYPNWTLNTSITKVGLQFQPGSYHVDISKLELAPQSVAMPQLALNNLGKLTSANALPINLPPNEGATLHFDVSKIKGAAGARLHIWEDGAQFMQRSDRSLYTIDASNKEEPIFHSDFMAKKEGVTLSPEVFSKAGRHYARAVAIDKNRKPIGLPTEPLAFRFKSTPGSR